jgi:hypothetical protein
LEAEAFQAEWFQESIALVLEFGKAFFVASATLKGHSLQFVVGQRKQCYCFPRRPSQSQRNQPNSPFHCQHQEPLNPRSSKLAVIPVLTIERYFTLSVEEKFICQNRKYAAEPKTNLFNCFSFTLHREHVEVLILIVPGLDFVKPLFNITFASSWNLRIQV